MAPGRDELRLAPKSPNALRKVGGSAKDGESDVRRVYAPYEVAFMMAEVEFKKKKY